MERRTWDVEQAEAELHVATHTCAVADETARNVERALRDAWDTVSAGGGERADHLDRIAELRTEWADVMQQKLEAHRAVDLAAERVHASRLGLEAAEARARHLRGQIAQQETAVAAAHRGVTTAEQDLSSRREVLEAEERALRQLQRQLSELAGS